jgi:manganese/zinc/iron transport system permease protein
MAMLSDAISHAVLPGIVLAFLISGSRDQALMLPAAALIGILTTLFIEYLQQKGKMQSDAAIGLVFTTLFAIGVILISAFAGQVDLDQECVLYGEIAYLPLDTWITGSGVNMGPRPLYILAAVCIINLVLVLLAYPYLKLTSFDPKYALALGISVPFWNYLLMAAVSLTSVATFESVGAILVVAFFVVPPATAYLITKRLSHMITLTIGIGILTATGGYFMAVWLNSSIAGAMGTVSGIILAMVFSYAQLKRQWPSRPEVKNHLSETT